MSVSIGDWVVYKGIQNSATYRVAEISSWDIALIYDAFSNNKYSREVHVSRLEVR